MAVKTTQNPDGTVNVVDDQGRVLYPNLPPQTAEVLGRGGVVPVGPVATPTPPAVSTGGPVKTATPVGGGGFGPFGDIPRALGVINEAFPGKAAAPLAPEVPLAGPESVPAEAAPAAAAAPVAASPTSSAWQQGAQLNLRGVPVQIDGNQKVMGPFSAASLGTTIDSPETAQAALAAAAFQEEKAKARPGGYVAPQPERDVETSSAKVIREDVPPEMLDAYSDTMKAQAQVALERGLENEAANKAAAVFHAATAEKAEQELAKLRELQAEREAAVDRQMTIIESRMNDVREMAAENPVEKYWEQKGAFGTIMTKIGMVLSTIGSTVARAPNVVVDTVNRELDREMAVQQMKVAGAYKGLDAEMTLLGQLQKTMLSPEGAVSATKALLAEQIASETKALAAAMNSESARTAALSEAAKISQQAAEYLIKAKQLEADTTTRQYKHLQATRGGYYGGKQVSDVAAIEKAAKRLGVKPVDFARMFGGDFGAGQKITEGVVAKEKHRESVQVPLPPSMRGNRRWDPLGTGVVFAPEGAKEIVPQLNALDEMRPLVQRLEALVRKGGTATDPATVTEVSNIASRLKLVAKPAGILTEAMTIGEVPITVGPLSGDNITKIFRLKSQSLKDIEGIKGMIDARTQSTMGRTYLSRDQDPATAWSAMDAVNRASLPKAEDYKPTKK